MNRYLIYYSDWLFQGWQAHLGPLLTQSPRTAVPLYPCGWRPSLFLSFYIASVKQETYKDLFEKKNIAMSLSMKCLKKQKGLQGDGNHGLGNKIISL